MWFSVNFSNRNRTYENKPLQEAVVRSNTKQSSNCQIFCIKYI